MNRKMAICRRCKNLVPAKYANSQHTMWCANSEDTERLIPSTWVGFTEEKFEQREVPVNCDMILEYVLDEQNSV